MKLTPAQKRVFDAMEPGRIYSLEELKEKGIVKYARPALHGLCMDGIIQQMPVRHIDEWVGCVYRRPPSRAEGGKG